MKLYILIIGFLTITSDVILSQPNDKYKSSHGNYILKYERDTLTEIVYKSKFPFHRILYSVKFYLDNNNNGNIIVDRYRISWLRKKIQLENRFYVFDGRIIQSWVVSDFDTSDSYFYLYGYDEYPEAFIAVPRYGYLNLNNPDGYHGDLFNITKSELKRQNRISQNNGKLYIFQYIELNTILEKNKDNLELNNLIDKYLLR